MIPQAGLLSYHKRSRKKIQNLFRSSHMIVQAKNTGANRGEKKMALTVSAMQTDKTLYLPLHPYCPVQKYFTNSSS